MTKASASALFDKDWPKYGAFVNKSLPNVGLLNSNQFASLVDYAFNTGNGNPKYLKQYFEKYMEEKDFDAVCRDMQLAFTVSAQFSFVRSCFLCLVLWSEEGRGNGLGTP